MLAASLVVLSLLAQDAPPSPRSADAKARAQVLLKRGARHYQHAEYKEALEVFEQAYGLFPSPKLLMNIGQASRELGHTVEAINAFEQFLEQAGDAPPRAVAEAKQSIDEMEPQIAKLRIDCTMSGADISIDGKRVAVSPVAGLIRVIPGTHDVRASIAGAVPATKRTKVAAGAIDTIVLPLAPAPRTGVASRAVMKARPDEGWLLGRRWTWVAAGSAVVLAGGATAAGLVMQSRYQALDQSCGRSSGASYSGCRSSDVGSLDAWKNTANVLWGLSAAAVVTAGALFYFEGHAVAVAPTIGEVGLQARVGY
jgi:tetratricopeptide (TPR) repeat protein